MSDRSWFFASQGQQQGPYPEAQFGDFIARGTVTADTLVWCEGMAGWQKAGEVPGLMSAVGGPPGLPGRVPTSNRDMGSGAVSIDFGVWEFVWRSLVFVIGSIFVIPLPWVLVMYCRWIVSCTHVPGRPNLTFTGQPLTILWWYFGAIVLFIVISLTDIQALNALSILIQLGLYWLAIKWFVANLASNGQPLGLGFSGSYWAYLGWNILIALSFITVIGWAWVYTAQMRWVCRNIEGTRREVVFEATGLQYLWRALVVVLACCFIVPIPWVLRWFMRWHASQIVLVERTSHAAA
jgi:GYF domain 2